MLKSQASPATRWLQPVMGSVGLETQIRQLMPAIHVFGHSHHNVDVTREGIRYINRALGCPIEHGGNPAQLRSILQFDPHAAMSQLLTHGPP